MSDKKKEVAECGEPVGGWREPRNELLGAGSVASVVREFLASCRTGLDLHISLKDEMLNVSISESRAK